VTAAVSESQAKGTYLRDKFHRLKARMGTKKAAMGRWYTWRMEVEMAPAPNCYAMTR